MQFWSLAPVAASVVYCIGEDGHAGFELARPGASDCNACCPDEVATALAAPDREASGCTDIVISGDSAVSGKDSVGAATPSFAVVGMAASGQHASRRQLQPMDFDPPSSAATRLLRRTVLLI